MALVSEFDMEVDALARQYGMLVMENADLRAKLEEKQRMLDLANKALERGGSAARFGIKSDIPEGALVFRDTTETLERYWEDEPAYNTTQWRALEKDRDNLQVQLNAAEERLARVDKAIPGMLSIADEVQKVEVENRNLQAAYEAVRGALSEVIVAYGEGLIPNSAEIKAIMVKVTAAFYTTPAEAGERVRGLVEAVEEAIQHDYITPELREALAKYRGGAK